MTSQPPKPAKFEPAGSVRWATFVKEQPNFITRGPKRGAKAQGIRYERKVQEWLLDEYSPYYLDGPWLCFRNDSSKIRWCQPDGLLFDVYAGRITIVEIKYQHTDRAWWQLKELYLPVLEYIFPKPEWEFRLVEICKWYDPTTFFPSRHFIRPRIEDAKENEVSVTIWKP